MKQVPRAKPSPRESQIAERAGVERFRAQHLDLAERVIETERGPIGVTVDQAESPLAWLARRKRSDGRPLIEPVQLQAGERLREEFTRAQLMPRITANWDAAVARGRRGATTSGATDTVIAARQRVRHALEAVGPEFAGVLLDVCCFLKSLADIERDRNWPARSGKVVLQLALDRLARHYGLNAAAHGRRRAEVKTWLAPDVEFVLNAEKADQRGN